MAMSKEWSEVSVAEFARALAARAPVPGSGSAAAAGGALGAGLASMALCSGRDEPCAAVRELDGLREELLTAITADGAAYAAWCAARRERADEARALASAIEVPRSVVAAAARALALLSAGRGEVAPRLSAEAGVAARLLLAALQGASVTARVNLLELPDPLARAALERELARLEAGARADTETLTSLAPPSPPA